MADNEIKNEIQARACTNCELLDDEALLKKIRGIFQKSILWWEECVSERKGKGIVLAADSARSSLAMVEKLEAKIAGVQSVTSRYVVEFANPPDSSYSVTTTSADD